VRGIALWLLGASVAFLATAVAFLLLANLDECCQVHAHNSLIFP
jgi:hypothetical protein